jgi:hypothetical protein
MLPAPALRARCERRSRSGDAAILSVRPEDLVAAEEGISATVASMEYRGRAFFGLARTVMDPSFISVPTRPCRAELRHG